MNATKSTCTNIPSSEGIKQRAESLAQILDTANARIVVVRDSLKEAPEPGGIGAESSHPDNLADIIERAIRTAESITCRLTEIEEIIG